MYPQESARKTMWLKGKEREITEKVVKIIAGFLISILLALIFYIVGTKLGKQIEEYA